MREKEGRDGRGDMKTKAKVQYLSPGALKVDAGRESRNVGSLWELQKAGK